MDSGIKLNHSFHDYMRVFACSYQGSLKGTIHYTLTDMNHLGATVSSHHNTPSWLLLD